MSNVPVVETRLIVTSQDTEYKVPGDMSISQLVNAYSANISGLSSMAAVERLEFSASQGGNIRIVTFSPRTGTKG